MRQKILIGLLSVLITGSELQAFTIPDPGFEHGENTNLAGWGGGTWSPPGIPRRSAQVMRGIVHTGNRSLYLHGIHHKSIVWLEMPDQGVLPGERYLLTAFLKPETAMLPNALIRVQLYFADANGRALPAGNVEGERLQRPAPILGWDNNAAIRNTQAAINLDFAGYSAQWLPIGFAFEVPANAASVKWRITLIGEGAVYIDDVHMERNTRTVPPAFPPRLWQGGNARLEMDVNGKQFIQFSIKNELSQAIENRAFAVFCNHQKIGEVSNPLTIAPGQTQTVQIPIEFPVSFSSPRAELKIRGESRIGNMLEENQWVLFTSVEPRTITDAASQNQWGVVPLLGNTALNLAGTVTTDNGKRQFCGKGVPIPLKENTSELSFIMQLDNPSLQPVTMDINWTLTDFFWRSTVGKTTIQIPAKHSVLHPLKVPAAQLERFKQVLLRGGCEFFRLQFQYAATKQKQERQTLNLSFLKPEDTGSKLSPLPYQTAKLPIFGELRLIDEVLCGNPHDQHPLRQGGKGLFAKYSSEPLGYYGGSNVLNFDWQKEYQCNRMEFTSIATLLGRSCRIASDNGWFSYKLGRNSLIPGRYYLLEIEYPDDKSRNWLISNRMYSRGNIGFSTGSALWDSPNRQRFMQRFDLPLSGKFQRHRTIMRAQRPEDWFSIHTLGTSSNPLSEGAAVYAMRLYEIGDENALKRYSLQVEEPEGLPTRMLGHLSEDNTPDSAVLPLYKIYGHNVFAPLTISYCGTALAARCGNLGQVRYGSKLFGPDHLRHPMALKHKGYFHILPKELNNYMNLGSEFNFAVVPVLEYGGTGRLPTAAMAVNPDGSPVFFRWGSAPSRNGGARSANQFKEGWAIDMAHPAVGEDMAALVTELADQYPQIKGIVLTLRFQAWQVGYGADTLAAFAKETRIPLPAKNAAKFVQKKYLAAYMQFHYRKKHENFKHAAAALQAKHPDKKLLILNYNGGDDNLHFGNPLYLWGSKTTDRFVPGTVAFPDLRGVDLVKLMEDYRRHEIRQMSVGMNPELYRQTQGLFNLAPVRYPYISGNQRFLDEFRTGEGSAVCFWWLYNEDAAGSDTAVNVPAGLHGSEAAGRYSMLDEVLTMAHADPFVMFFRIGEFNRGYIEYARAFAQAYRALPAVPSEILNTGSAPDVVVRCYRTERGIFLGVVNTALQDMRNVVIRAEEFPKGSVLRNLSDGQIINEESGIFKLAAEPVSLQAFRVEQP